MDCTTLGSESMPSTSTPSPASSSASDMPNRPSPMTATPPTCFLANERPSFRELVEALALAEGER